MQIILEQEESGGKEVGAQRAKHPSLACLKNKGRFLPKESETIPDLNLYL
jgi:hypothetical protein